LLTIFSFIVTYLRRELTLGQMGFLIINLKAIINFLNDIDGGMLMSEGKLRVRRLDGKSSFD
jgi:hypothetical protein